MSTNYMRDKLHRNQMIMPWGKPETISTGDAAAMLQCSTFTIRQLLEDGTLKGFQMRPGVAKSTWRVNRLSVERHAESIRLQAGIDPDGDCLENSARSASDARPASVKAYPRR